MGKDAVVDGFLATLKSDLTRKFYSSDLRCLAASVGGRPHEATFEQCRAYFEKMREDGMATTTIMRHMASTRSFFEWVVGKGYRKDNPIKGMTPGPAESSAKIILPLASEVETMKKAALARQTDTGIRLYLAVMLTTGHGKALEPLVRLSTQEVRTILGPQEGVVEEYLGRCGDTPFINKHGEKISARSMRRLLIALCESCGTTRLDWRELRYFAVRAAMEGGLGVRETASKFGVTQGTLSAIGKAEWR